MHMRVDLDQFRIETKNARARYCIVLRSRWNGEGVVECRETEDSFLRRCLGKDQSDAGTVRCGFTIRGVVQLKYEVRPFRNQHSIARLEIPLWPAWYVSGDAGI